MADSDKSNLEKTNDKGSPQYDEWLRKYRLKRNKNKRDDEVSNRRTADSTQRIDYALKSIDKAFGLAGPTAKRFFDVLDRVERADGKSAPRSVRLQNQLKAILEDCKEDEIPYSSISNNYERLQNWEGSESHLYADEGSDFLLKVVDFMTQSETPYDFIVDRIILHNAIFPQTAYDFYGFTEDEEGRFRFVLTQNIIKGGPAPQEKIDSYIKSLGFKETKHKGWFENDSYIISDLHPKNVLEDELGNLYVIDEVITRK